jgi:hypothetical protein
VSFDEGIQKRVRFQDQHKPGRGHRFTHRSYSAVDVAEATARALVAGWLRRPSLIDTLQRQALDLDPLT